MKLENMVAGMTLYDCHKHKAGNTSIRVMGVWLVRVIEVHGGIQHAYVLASWNSNGPRKYARAQAERWKSVPPEWAVYSTLGGYECHFCGAHGSSSKPNSSAHKPHCRHPKAVAWREKNP